LEIASWLHKSNQPFLSLLDRAKAQFPKPTAEHYWHYLMLNNFNEVIYQPLKVAKKVEEIKKNRGFNNFSERQGALKMTPAHVAVLAGNVVGLKFLQSKNALAVNVQDAQGKTPLDYARQMQPNLVSLFETKPLLHRIEKIDLPWIVPLFKKWRVTLPQGPFTYHGKTDDLGVQIKTLRFARPSDLKNPEFAKAYSETGLKIEHFAQNLECLANFFGFQLELSKYQYALRDHIFRFPNGSFATFNNSPHVPAAVEKCNSLGLFRGSSKATFSTEHDVFMKGLGAAFKQRGKGNENVQALTQYEEGVPALRFYAEGGNQYLLTHPSGEKILVIGEDTQYIALHQMQLDKVFDDPSLDLTPYIESYSLKLKSDTDFLRQTLAEMYSQGLLSKGKGKEKGLISATELVELFSDINLFDKMSKLSLEEKKTHNFYLEAAIKHGYYKEFALTDIDLGENVPLAAVYLAQKEITLDIFAATYGLNGAEKVCVVPQLDSHVDDFLRPWFKGGIAIQDYALCLELLKEVKKNAQVLQLTPLDHVMLERYLTTAEKLNGELGHLIKQTKEVLTKAGFPVIPAPGIFYDVSSRLLNPLNPDVVTTYNLNFLNAITGWSKESYFYLVTGAQVGDRLGQVLMNAFEQFVHSYEPNTEVCFVGYDPKNPTDFSEGMRWLNRRGSQLGLHCLGVETETIDHQG
jgi:hypothetical protein